MLKLVIPAHLEAAIESACQGSISERDLINEIKFLLGFNKDSCVRKALAELDCALSHLAAKERLSTCGLAKVEHFAASMLTA